MGVPEYVYQEGIKQGCTMEACCALLAQLQEESAFNPYNLEDTANKKLGMSDQEYVRSVDNGSYANFVNDGFGFGLFQVTFHTRKRQFLEWMKAKGLSIGNTEGQVAFIWYEMKKDFPGIWEMMKSSHDLYELTKKLLYTWENPDEKVNNLKRRYGYAQSWLAKAQNGSLSKSESGSTTGGSKSMSKVEQYTQEAINIANDNSHGYSQADRYGPDFDCSSLVNYVVQRAGIPVITNGASYTGNMRSAYLRSGFRDVTASCNLNTGSGMMRGDILLNDAAHAAIHIGNGRVVHARTDEGNPQSGDQSGNEIRTQSYWNYPWSIVMRYSGDTGESSEGSSTSGSTDTPVTTGNLRKGSKGARVKELQENLIKLGISCGKCGADGDFGNATRDAVIEFQKRAFPDQKSEWDGIVGPKTQAAIEKALKELAPEKEIKKGDTVRFKGGNHYSFADKEIQRTSYARPGVARVTIVKPGAKHPYHVVRLAGSDSNVFGWVDADTIEVI